MSEDIVDLAISMAEIDTGMQLPLEERESMKQRILARIEGINQYRNCGAFKGIIFLFCAKLLRMIQ